MRKLALNIASIGMVFLLTILSVEAQEQVCDLKLRIYSYERVNKPKPRLRDVTVRLRGKGVDQTHNVSVGSNVDGFTGLKERTYGLEVSKPGYKTRRKKIDLDCRLQYGNAVWDHTYLWPEKRNSVDDDDLVENPKDDFQKSSGGGGTGSTDVSNAATDKLFGSVTLEVLIDVDGNVVSASRFSGERKLAEKAISLARTAKFSPTILSGEAVQVSGRMTYNFVP